MQSSDVVLIECGVLRRLGRAAEALAVLRRAEQLNPHDEKVAYERGLTLRALMMTGVELDIASSAAILNRLPATERPAWLKRLGAGGTAIAHDALVEGTLDRFAAHLAEAIDLDYLLSLAR